MMKLIKCVILALFLLPGISQAQHTPPDSTEFSPRRLRNLAIGTAVVYTGSLVWLSQQWYSDFEKQPFHFFNDAGQWKQMDKAGHAYGAFQLQSASYQALRWTGLERNKSLLWSAVSSFTFMATIEVMDGFSEGYGASVSDLAANTLGIGLYTAQQLGWKEIRIHPKYGFRRSSYAELRPEVLGNGLLEEMLKDYNGQTYWLSFDISAFTKGNFPKWLNVAVGYGAEEMIYATDKMNIEAGLDPYRQWYLAIDPDLSHIHTRSGFLNTLLFFVNMVRIPAPAVEFSNKNVTFHWLY